ncbi:MAG TPA: FHA domain-containing protein [Thermoleophilaceae bacterium]|nr:FHA domain-containing protein [Thermoleophilaceae bacterium]
MQTVVSGTLAGAGTFRCQDCSYPVALLERDEIPPCPRCGSREFKRASIFAERSLPESDTSRRETRPEWLDEARAALVEQGDYLAFEEDERVRVVPLQEGFTRIGRSLAAHIRFDDPTVSRRHAVIHREGDRARLLDDRSLNGVFVNGERSEWHELADGDEIVIGRFRLYFVGLTGVGSRGAHEGVWTAAR